MLSFRLWTIFYVFALSAAAMATFAASGIFVAAIVLGFWAWIYKAAPTSCLQWAIVLFLIVLALLLFLPAVQVVRESSRSGTCLNNLKNITLATIAHEAALRQFPAVHTLDANNQPLHSWRVRLLPRLEQQGIFQTVQFDEPWDSPSNRAWSTVALDCYRCPSEGSTAAITNYFAIVGPQTAWPSTGNRKMSDLKDGPEQTILLIEDRGRNIQWAEPNDLTFAQAADLLSKPIESDEAHRRENGFFYKPTIGRGVAFADGRVALIRCPIDRQLAEALLTVAGGEKIDASMIRRITEPQLDYAKCYGVAMLLILSLLPVAWVGRRSGRIATTDSKSS